MGSIYEITLPKNVSSEFPNFKSKGFHSPGAAPANGWYALAGGLPAYGVGLRDL